MKDFTKVVRLGTNEDRVSVFCKIEFRDGRLSITGVEGPMRNGDARGACGQIVMHLRAEEIEPAPEWTRETIAEFLATWDRWHLNDMRAGSQVQEDYLRDHPMDPASYAYPKSHYTEASRYLTVAGLNPDPEGYSYGHAWKREEVPESVLAFLQSLPDTDREPAWI